MAQIGLCICNDFDFEIVNFQFLDGDVPRSTSYGVYISQLIPPKFVLLEHLAMLLLLYLRAPPLIYSGHKSVELKYWLVYNKKFSAGDNYIHLVKQIYTVTDYCLRWFTGAFSMPPLFPHVVCASTSIP